MTLTKVPQVMQKDAPISVLDYRSLATTVTAKSPSNPASHLFTSFLSWKLPIQAALDEAFNRGGGTVILPKNSVPYYIDDFVTVKSNTTLVCEDWIVLADYTSLGGSFVVDGDNILVQNLLLDNSNIFAGGSGENGINPNGSSITFIGGYVKNCQRGGVSPFDGGKGIQVESGDSYDISVTDMTFDNCFMAMSTQRSYSVVPPYRGIVYNSIVAFDCDIFFFVKQVDGPQDVTGLQHAISLSNFYARDCGVVGDVDGGGVVDDGVFQLSRAANVVVANGIVTTAASVGTPPLIRGNHSACTFSNIQFFSDCDRVIDIDPTYYAPDASQPNSNNRYDIMVLGQVDMLVDASATTPNRTIQNCFGSFQCENDVTTAWFGFEMRNGVSAFDLTQGSKTCRAVTNVNFNTQLVNPKKFSELEVSSDMIFSQFLNPSDVRFVPKPAASARNNSVYVDIGTGKLTFKDSGGTIHALY
jgi:hypothetical protein